MTGATPCPLCGYRRDTDPCPSCGGCVVDAPDVVPVRPGPGFFALDVVDGFRLFWHGLLLLFHSPRYAGTLKLAVAANLLTFAALSAFFAFGLANAIARLTASWDLGAWAGPFGWGQTVLAFVLALVAALALAPTLMQLVTGPFLDPIADVTEKLCGGEAMRSQIGTLRSLWLSVRTTLQIFAAQIVLLVPLLLLSFCGFGAVLAVLLSALFHALAWLDVAAARRGLSLADRLALVRANWARSLGFGLAVQLGLLVPFFNVLLLAPTAAAGITLVYLRFEKAPKAPAAAARSKVTPTPT
jgi:CysZ protein